MGYSTEFTGEFTVSPPLSDEVYNVLKCIATTRRMAWDTKKLAEILGIDEKLCRWTYGIEGEFYGVDDNIKPIKDALLYDLNTPPCTQPGLWNQWFPTSRTTIEWDGEEKFYNYTEWLTYIIKLLSDDGYLVNGNVDFINDWEKGVLEVVDNQLYVQRVMLTNDEGDTDLEEDDTFLVG